MAKKPIIKKKPLIKSPVRQTPPKYDVKKPADSMETPPWDEPPKATTPPDDAALVEAGKRLAKELGPLPDQTYEYTAEKYNRMVAERDRYRSLYENLRTRLRDLVLGLE